jgi:transposase
MPRKLKNPKMQSQWIELYQSGMSTNEIAKISDCHYKTVNNFLRANNITIRTLSDQWDLGRHKRIKAISDKELITLYQKGIGVEQLARHFGISNRRVSKVLKENGIPLRYGFRGLHSEQSKNKMSESRKGPKNHNWNGGISRRWAGHIAIKSPTHPFADQQGYVLKHRLVMEKHLGRYLKPTEVVHHIDGNPANNRFSNLMIFPSNAAHSAFHRKQNPRPKDSKGRFFSA